jgi:hypothetical protein
LCHHTPWQRPSPILPVLDFVSSLALVFLLTNMWNMPAVSMLMVCIKLITPLIFFQSLENAHYNFRVSVPSVLQNTCYLLLHLHTIPFLLYH